MSAYCVRGCTRPRRHQADCLDDTCSGCEPQRTETGHLCHGCLDRLDTWLTEIPERYALLPSFIEPSAERDKNPEAKATKRTQAPVPIRLDVLDLLDTRRGRKWLGLAPTTDRRGTLGTLLAIGNELRDKPRGDSTVIHEADWIRGSLHRLAHIDHVEDIYEELRTLHRQLGDATGQHPPRPVGTCGRIRPNTDNPCGGQIIPSDDGGAHCRRCNADWDYENLRFLGTLIEDEPA